jgi:hypothetical protein
MELRGLGGLRIPLVTSAITTLRRIRTILQACKLNFYSTLLLLDSLQKAVCITSSVGSARVFI